MSSTATIAAAAAAGAPTKTISAAPTHRVSTRNRHHSNISSSSVTKIIVMENDRDLLNSREQIDNDDKMERQNDEDDDDDDDGIESMGSNGMDMTLASQDILHSRSNTIVSETTHEETDGGEGSGRHRQSDDVDIVVVVPHDDNEEEELMGHSFCSSSHHTTTTTPSLPRAISSSSQQTTQSTKEEDSAFIRGILSNSASHTPPSSASYEFRHFGKRPRLGSSVSGRLRSASDLESQGLIDCHQKSLLKDLIISGDDALQEALDGYDRGDLQPLRDMIQSGLLAERSAAMNQDNDAATVEAMTTVAAVDIDVLGDLDFDFLNVGNDGSPLPPYTYFGAAASVAEEDNGEGRRSLTSPPDDTDTDSSGIQSERRTHRQQQRQRQDSMNMKMMMEERYSRLRSESFDRARNETFDAEGRLRANSLAYEIVDAEQDLATTTTSAATTSSSFSSSQQQQEQQWWERPNDLAEPLPSSSSSSSSSSSIVIHKTTAIPLTEGVGGLAACLAEYEKAQQQTRVADASTTPGDLAACLAAYEHTKRQQQGQQECSHGGTMIAKSKKLNSQGTPAAEAEKIFSNTMSAPISRSQMYTRTKAAKVRQMEQQHQEKQRKEEQQQGRRGKQDRRKKQQPKKGKQKKKHEHGKESCAQEAKENQQQTPEGLVSAPKVIESGTGRPRCLATDPNLKQSIDEFGLLRVERPEGWVGAYSPESRLLRIAKFMEKRSHRVWTKSVKYNVRKSFADGRLRVKGRFVKKEDELLMRELMSLT